MRTVLVDDPGEGKELQSAAIVNATEVESLQGFGTTGRGRTRVGAVLGDILGDVVGTYEGQAGLACGEAMAGPDRFRNVVDLVLFSSLYREA